MRLFGFGTALEGPMGSSLTGTIPTPAWKAEVFDGEPWRIGDTYNTAIGQYGFQVTPLQAVRAMGALANGGVLYTPRITERGDHRRLESLPDAKRLPFRPEHVDIVRSGMRDAVDGGTARGLDVPYVSVAAKTGTAQLGISKRLVNSWVTGFFPYEQPRYAFVVLMERGPVENLTGGVYVMRQLLDRMRDETPEYLEVHSRH